MPPDQNERLARVEAHTEIIIEQLAELREELRSVNANFAQHYAEDQQFHGKIAQKFDNYDTNIARFYEENNFGGIPARVTELEKQQEKLKPFVAGVTTVIAAVIGAIVAAIAKLLGG